jgi:hypothetical protein
MKKKVYIPIVISVLAMTSCKKNYQCDCNRYDSSGNYIKTTSNTYKERKRTDAQAACAAKSSVTAAETVNCVIIN